MAHDYEAIAKAIVNEHVTYTHWKTGEKTTSYDPCYFDQGFSDTNEEVMSAFISGELTKDGYPRWRELAEDALGEWESDCIWHDAGELVDEFRKEREQDDTFDEDFDYDELRDEIRYALEEARTQDVQIEWLRDMRQPIVRVMLTDEDHPDSWVENDEDWTPERLATLAGIEHSEKNLKACQTIIDNAYYPGTCKMLFLVFRMDIPKESDGDKVRIAGEVELWACNPFMGDGMADTVDIDITLDRSKLATDKEAAGYSYNEVFGPVISMIPEPDVTFYSEPPCPVCDSKISIKQEYGPWEYMCGLCKTMYDHNKKEATA